MCEQCGQEHSVKAAHWIGNYFKKERKKEKKEWRGGKNSRLIMLLAMKMKTLINAVWLFKQTTPECVVCSALPFNLERVDWRSFIFAASLKLSAPLFFTSFSEAFFPLSDTIWSRPRGNNLLKTTGLHSTVPPPFLTHVRINCSLIVRSASGPG